MKRLCVALALLTPVVSSCGGGGHGARRSGGSRATVVRGDGVRYAVPPGWHVARRSLTPHLANPRELLTIGTGPVVSGDGCAQIPTAALKAMRPTDVLLTVQERFGNTARFPPRPAHFRLPAVQNTDAQACTGPKARLETHWFEFRDGGRGFHVLVAVAPAAPRRRVRQAVEVLDSLHVTPRRPARINPDDAIPYDDPGRGLALVYPTGWRLYPHALTQAISARDQIALGTFVLHQRRPDPNCTPKTALRARPYTGGFLYLFEYEGLNRRQLARFPARPTRLRLPRSSFQPYECLGPSWMVRFRDGGRAFQAHVYGPPTRRRQALAILDSLQIRPAPFATKLDAARFPAARGWRTRVSITPPESPCAQQRISWAATVAFADAGNDLPPHKMIERLPPDGIIMAAVQYRDDCRRPLRGIPALRPPLNLAGATRSQFPGSRGDELPLYRVIGRFAGRYQVDVWIFFGRRHPTGAQRARAQRELGGVRWPAWL
jgi:hypothetical protein